MSKTKKSAKRAASSTAKRPAAALGKKARSLGKKMKKRVERQLGPAARKAKKQIGKALKVTAEAARKSAKVLAIRAKISARQLRVQTLYTKMGESYYRALKDGLAETEIAGVLRPQVAAVDNFKEEIGSLQLQEKAIRASR